MTAEKEARIVRAWLNRELAKKKQQQLKKLNEIEQSLAENEQLLAEFEQLRAEKAQFDQDLDRAFNWAKDKPVGFDYRYSEETKRYIRVKKYARRPPRWLGRDGYDLVSGILSIQAQDKCKIAPAIRKLKEANPAKWPETQRTLEWRFQEAKKYWASWYARKAMLDARQEALLAKRDL